MLSFFQKPKCVSFFLFWILPWRLIFFYYWLFFLKFDSIIPVVQVFIYHCRSFSEAHFLSWLHFLHFWFCFRLHSNGRLVPVVLRIIFCLHFKIIIEFFLICLGSLEKTTSRSLAKNLGILFRLWLWLYWRRLSLFSCLR